MNKIEKALLIGVLLVSALFRLINLGYSEFQGDEVAAQNYLFGEQKFTTFLLTRTVGPAQYAITKLVNISLSLIPFAVTKPEAFVRLPFTTAGIAFLIILTLLTGRFFGIKTALFTIYFSGFSGLLIAFSRTAQYQSFVMLLSVCCVYLTFLYIKTQNKKYIILSGALSGLALLFHYDSLSFIVSILLILCLSKMYKACLSFCATLVTVCLPYYIFFFTNPAIKQTTDYILSERIAGGNAFFKSIPYSLQLMYIYHPFEYLIPLVVGVAFFVYFYFTRENPKLWSKRNLYETAISVWFAVPFAAYGLIFSKPLTHIYNFLIPMMLLSAIGWSKILRYIPRTAAIIFTASALGTASFNYAAFINHTPEYPWNAKDYIFGKMPSVISNGGVVNGIFGFPYHRRWNEIAKKLLEIKTATGHTKYNSNEKYRLTKYYLKDFKWDNISPQIYIWIDKPQSLEWQSKPTRQPIIETETYSIYLQR